MHQKKRNHDNVVAVGQVDDATVQVVIPKGMTDKYMWRIIRNDGQTVTSGKVLYDAIDQAFNAAITVVIPDAIPVQHKEPEEKDYDALEMLLFGFKDGARFTSFQEVVVAHSFLAETLDVLKLAQEKLPGDYDRLHAAWCDWYDQDAEEAKMLRQLKELAVQGQEVLVRLCERDLETLSAFIAEFIV